MKDRCMCRLFLHGERTREMADLGCYLQYGHGGDHAWNQEVRHGAGGSCYEGIQIEVRWHDLEVEE